MSGRRPTRAELADRVAELQTYNDELHDIRDRLAIQLGAAETKLATIETQLLSVQDSLVGAHTVIDTRDAELVEVRRDLARATAECEAWIAVAAAFDKLAVARQGDR